MPPWFIPILSAAGETGIITLAAFLLFHHRKCTVAESLAYGILSTVMALSFIYQVSFILGMPLLAIALEVLLCIGAGVAAARLLGGLSDTGRVFREFVSDYPLPSALAGLGMCLLGAQALLLPPTDIQWQEMSQMVLFYQHQGFFHLPTDKALTPLNHAVLPYLFLRSNTGIGADWFGFMAYLSIAFSTFALSRRYSWPHTSVTVMMIVISMPRVVFQAMSPGAEILPAAAALLGILAVTRSIEQPNIGDLIMLVLAVLFTISGGETCLILPIILTALFGILLIRRHGMAFWWGIVLSRRWTAMAALIPAAVFSQIWLFLYNQIRFNVWFRQGVTIPPNKQALWGAAANLVRYIFESAHPTEAFDRACNWAMGFTPTGMFQRIYDIIFAPLFQNAGAAAPFLMNRADDPSRVWFGPFAFLFILPVLFYSLVRGHRRFKAISIALVGYLYIITLMFAWAPGNAGLFTVFYVCGGFFIALLLPPWRFTRGGRRMIQMICGFLLFYALLIETGFLPLQWP
jgi:hypothetical protein